MEERTRGHCAACGTVGQGEKDFICDRCVNPDGGTVICRGCGSRLTLTFLELQEFVADVEGIEKPLPPGTALVAPSCPMCDPAEMDEGESEITVLTTRHVPN